MASYAGYSIKKSIEILNNYKKNLNDKTEIPRVKIRLESELLSMQKMIEELLVIITYNYGQVPREDMQKLSAQINRNLRFIPKIENVQDAIDIIDSLNDYKSLNFDRIESYEFNAVASRLVCNRFDTVEELSKEDINKIISAININRDFNVFSTRGRRGDTLKYIKEKTDKAQTYALEEDEDLLRELKTHCNRTIKGILNGSRISNDVFDIMYLCPKISWEYSFTELGGLMEKSEKSMLRSHIKHLRNNGLFIFNIPFFRLTSDVALIASKLLDNVQIIRKSDDKLKQVLIIGTKKITRDAKEDIYAMLSSIKYEEIPTDLSNKYVLASGGIKLPEIFRGSALDQDEIQNLINNSGLMNSFWKKHEVDKNKQSTRPLMPFNMGQIGLVLTSGCLDGTVEEYEGQYHAIKGMVTKIKHTNSSSDTNREETVTETISNKVQINIVTPNGDFIELA